jgi:hypothetical protein
LVKRKKALCFADLPLAFYKALYKVSKFLISLFIIVSKNHLFAVSSTIGQDEYTVLHQP